MADQAARIAKRSGDRVAELQALVRQGHDYRPLGPCRHCGAARDRLTVVCGDCGGSGEVETYGKVCPYTGAVDHEYAGCESCGTTGRVPWPWADRLAIAAYAGDPAARVLVGGHPRRGGSWPVLSLGHFLRWPGAALVAALAAGYAVLERKRREGCGEAHVEVYGVRMHGPGCFYAAPARALKAASDHAACGCAESLEAWDRASAALGGGHAVPWCPRSPRYAHHHCRAPVNCPDAAARETDEATIRAAVCEALVGWALRGEVPGGR